MNKIYKVIMGLAVAVALVLGMVIGSMVERHSFDGTPCEREAKKLKRDCLAFSFQADSVRGCLNLYDEQIAKCVDG